MIRCLASFVLAAAMPAYAQPPAPESLSAESAETPAEASVPETSEVILQTGKGTIVLALETERAPVTSANFLRYAEEGRLDGTTFYRAMKVAEGYGLVQGGARNDPERILEPIAHEPTTQTGLSHTDGTISMARAAPGSANMDFFIIVGDLVSLDADPAAPGDNLGYAAFGRVTEGMDIVRAILAAPIDPEKGEGVMKGQMLAAPVEIIRAVPSEE